MSLNKIMLISIFVSKTCEAMTEFMDDNRFEIVVLGRNKIVRIQNATTAIPVGIDQYDDMLVRNTSQQVMKIEEMEGGKITIAIERIKVRMESCFSPNAIGRLACTTFLRRRHDGHDAESRFHAFKWFVAEERIAGHTNIVDEIVHLPLAVSFRYIGDVNAAGSVVCLLNSEKRSPVFFADMSYQDVGRIHLVGVFGSNLSAVVHQAYRN